MPEVMRERSGAFGEAPFTLEVRPEKIRLIEFGRLLPNEEPSARAEGVTVIAVSPSPDAGTPDGSR